MNTEPIKQQSGSSLVRLIKPLLFIAIIVTAVFGAAELLLILAGIKSISSTEDPLVGFAGNIPLFIEETGVDGDSMLLTAENKLRLFNHQAFPKQKGRDTYRIFCLGGSTTYGRPYKDSTSFCGWLRVFLQTADPTRRWEVINAGGVSYASYRVARLMQELGQYQPDLFIVYSGQNEFLEKRSYGNLKEMPQWLLATDAILSKTRIYTVLKKGINNYNSGSQTTHEKRFELSDEVNEVLRHTAGPTTYSRNDKLKQQILTHYRLNLGRMAQMAQELNAGIIFVKPVVNLKDMSPFKSEHKEGLNTTEISTWDKLIRQANDKYNDNNFEQALDLYQQALQIDERYAETHYRIGKILFSLGDFDAAETAFWRAIDEDIAPLRMLSSMPGIISKVAERYDVPLVDYEEIIRTAYLRQYNHAVFGNEYFLDHVHSNIEGYRLLGLSLLDQLVSQGIVTTGKTWSEASISQISNRVLSSLNKRDHGAALVRLGRVLDWAGKFDEAHTLFLKSIELVGPNGYVYSMLGKNAVRNGNPEEAIGYFRQAVEIAPELAWVHSALGDLLAKAGDITGAIEYYRKALDLESDDINIHRQLAVLLAIQEETDAAIYHFREALHSQPDDESSLYNYMVLLAKQEKYKEAESLAHRSLDVNKNNALVYNNLGIILAKQDKLDLAIIQFKEALRINPDFKEARENLIEAKSMYNRP